MKIITKANKISNINNISINNINNNNYLINKDRIIIKIII